MSIREVVTFQVGHYANYVGTHWWNLQEAAFSYDPAKPSEVNNDVLFREGYTPTGVSTYLPRLIAIDLSGSLGRLKQDGVLYDVSTKSEFNLWTDAMEIQKTEPYPSNEYMKFLEQQDKELCLLDSDKDICPEKTNLGGPSLPVPYASRFNLDESVNVWADYLCPHLHPKSIHLLNEYSHGNEVEIFDVYCYGQRATTLEHNMDAIEQRIRYFVEECDNLQGFQLLADGNNGFVGSASAISSYIKDEFSNKMLITVPLYDVSSVSQKSARHSSLVNSFVGLKELSSFADLIIPMSCFTSLEYFPNPVRSFPLLNFKPDLPYHTSGILASALDTATVAYRLREQSIDMHDLITLLNAYGRKVALLSAIYPLPLWENVSIVETLLKRGSDVLPQMLTPTSTVELKRSFSQNFVVRGLPLNMKINWPSVTQKLKGAEGVSSFEEFLYCYLNDVSPAGVSSLGRLAQQLSVSDPFPHIFDDHVSADGLICSEKRSANTGVSSVPLISGLHSSRSLKDMLENLIRGIGKVNVRKLHKFIDAGLEPDELPVSIEEMKELCDCYDDIKMN